MNGFATTAARQGIGDMGWPRIARRAGAGLPSCIAAVILAAALGVAGAARAENECGRLEAGTPVVCLSSNYDAATDGNVVHRPGTTGATGLRAPHGARDVTLAASETVAGRAFASADFAVSWVPRAALYEALPGFLVRLEDRWSAGGRPRRPGVPARVRLSGGKGSYSPDRASAAAAYDFERLAAKAGLEAALSPSGALTGSVSLRRVRGSADVSASTGIGRIEAEGVGASVRVFWEDAAGWYARGRVSLTRYDADLSADDRGLLTERTRVTVRTLGVEAGRRFPFAGGLSLTPRARLARSKLSMDGFRIVAKGVSASAKASSEDAVGWYAVGRVSLTRYDADLSADGQGLLTERARAAARTVWVEAGRRFPFAAGLSLTPRARLTHLDVSAADVAGERLVSEPRGTRLVAGLGGTWRRGRWALAGEVAAAGLNSDDTDYTANLHLGVRF